jgi:YolD-like protein.
MRSNNQNNRRYEDIINLPHHVSAKHPSMPAADRAVQFAPFAALNGFGAAITETGRLTDEKAELDEYEKAALNDKLSAIAEQLDEHPTTVITFFQPDKMKSGGAYITVTGTVKKIDEYERRVVLTDGKEISIDDIMDIEVLP